MRLLISDANDAISAIRKEWGWFLALGIALAVLGVAAILYQGASTIASVITLGGIMMAAGVVQLALMIQAHGTGHVILYLLLGVLDLIVGFVLIMHPAVGALAVTLVLSAYFIAGGLYRVIYALWLQFPQYGWVVFSGIIMLALGFLLWAQWPASAFWFPGLAVGVNFIFIGVSWIALAIHVRGAMKIPVGS